MSFKKLPDQNESRFKIKLSHTYVLLNMVQSSKWRITNENNKSYNFYT